MMFRHKLLWIGVWGYVPKQTNRVVYKHYTGQTPLEVWVSTYYQFSSLYKAFFFIKKVWIPYAPGTCRPFVIHITLFKIHAHICGCILLSSFHCTCMKLLSLDSAGASIQSFNLCSKVLPHVTTKRGSWCCSPIAVCEYRLDVFFLF